MFRKFVVPVLAAVAIIFGASVSAQAAVVDIIDARGDVHRLDVDGDQFVLTEGEQRADILRTRIQHAGRALVVSTKLARLAREGREVGMTMRVRTNEGIYRVVDLTASRRIGWGGRAMMASRRAMVECRVGHNINYATDAMKVRIPRSCLGNPRWVQATLVTVFFGGRKLLADNPHNNTMRINRVWTERIRRG